jgi:drug/metabolite transporter (DMT)-like permease
MLLALGLIGVYVVLVGVASFLEEPIARRIDAFRLDAALRLGALAMAVAALFVARMPPFPSPAAAAAGFGIGSIAGLASISYCVALSRTRAWLAAAVANGYVAVTVVLGVAILGDPLGWLTAGGLALTLAGVVALSWRGSGGGSHVKGQAKASAAIPLLGYVALAGVSTFLEKPALGRLAPLQLNALTALGMATVGVVVVVVRDRRPPLGASSIAAAGVGLMIGLGGVAYFLGLVHLPVSVAATVGNAYVLVTTALAVVVRRQTLGRWQIAGAVATIAGVCLLTATG